MPIQAFRPDSKQILNPFDIVRRAQLKIDSIIKISQLASPRRSHLAAK